MDTYFIQDKDITRLYDRIAIDYELYVPVKSKSALKLKCEYSFLLPTDDYILKKYSRLDKDKIVFNEYRPIEPARAFFTRFKEEICDYFTGDIPESERPVAICGLKNCDLFSLKIQDFVFLGGAEQDPFYKVRRENALIISGDCPAFKEACFCRAFNIDPYVSEGFDFNLSPVVGGYILDVGSEKARRIASSIKDVLTPAASNQLSMRELNRESVVEHMDEHLSYHKIPKKETLKEIVLAGYNSQVWNEQMKTCVECGGCVFMCDTCHCFLLSDEPANSTSEVGTYEVGLGKRQRVWDGCLYKNFTRVAGGANPLKMRYMRLRNRYLKKFDFFIDNIGYQACCGCGRCIDVCPGKIDIRYILRRLYEEKYIPAR
jgi:ferredoxin